jgi:creatinine amidohydrolase
MNPWRLQELTLKETQKRFKVAILPVGSVEAHGYHLPYGSDAFHSTAIAEHVCSEA